jgi:hypothetical protein
VTLLEFAQPEQEEEQGDPPQEGGAIGETDPENLPKCPNHQPTMFVIGKP